MKLNMVDVCGDGVQRGEVFKISCRWLELKVKRELNKQKIDNDSMFIINNSNSKLFALILYIYLIGMYILQAGTCYIQVLYYYSIIPLMSALRFKISYSGSMKDGSAVKRSVSHIENQSLTFSSHLRQLTTI